MNPQIPEPQTGLEAGDQGAVLPEEQASRAGMYSVLAALLRVGPGAAVREYVGRLEGEAGETKGDLAVGLNLLSLAARHSSAAALRDEYHALFIGLGRGELVPYGSWYQTGFLMEQPLGLLRADLARLGFERADDVREPEDHIAALCEVMSFLVRDGVEVERQRQFFDSHLGSWAGGFFADLSEARSAVFYRSVGRVGTAFIGLEGRYLSLLD
jgi:TorA maturation chaperone TorD